MNELPNFVIWAGPFDETSGGTVALHTLAARLAEMGVDAAIWPAGKWIGWRHFQWRAALAYYRRGAARGFGTGPFRNRVARRRDLDGAIVVYPEVVAGNPLGCPHVVRWFLHRPGHFTGEASYGANELYFFYNPAFNNPAINPHTDHLLRPTYVHPAYRKTNEGPRTGSCYIVRKGADRTLDQHPADAIRVDELSHQEKAAVFNRAEYLISYDPYTFYTHFAAICGCTPVVVPVEGVSKEEWAPDPAQRLGHAYGFGEVAWARDSRDAMLEAMEAAKEEERGQVRRFVDTCRAFFGATR